MKLYESRAYLDDISYVASLNLAWEKLQDKKVMLSGGTGLIGSFFVDVLLWKNMYDALNCTIYLLGRSRGKFLSRFYPYINDPQLIWIPYQADAPLMDIGTAKIDYVLHLASNTHPVLYATDPIGTITTNIIGVQNLLEFASSHHASGFVFASSNEIYGENRGDVEFFDEDYCGYINCNTLRAGYPESKRCAEALCQAYQAQKGFPVLIARLTRSYGPTMQMTDTKAISQFIKNGLSDNDIVLKSAGLSYYSFTYVADAVSGLFTILLNGKAGEAYNIAGETGDIQLKDLAHQVADICQKQVIYEVPDQTESVGFSPVMKARLDGKKLALLGWKARYDIKSGVERTLCILKEVSE